MSRFKSIEGFLLDEEAAQLYRLACSLPAASPVVVEIGSWLGKSTVVLGSALIKRPGARLVCVDPFDASGDPRSLERYQNDAMRLDSSLRNVFERNIRRAGVDRVVHVHQGYSADIVKKWTGAIDMLFIDGNHAFEAVKDDFSLWSTFVKAGGIVGLHDTYFEPTHDGRPYHTGPGEVVKRFVRANPEWTSVCHVGSLYVVRRAATVGAALPRR
jgi:predicted O-methyltransferase YrrM